MELDDDVFFADLSKQIALLITDEDEDEDFPVQLPPSVPIQGFPHVQQGMMLPPYGFEMACRRESKGTGVFIPRSPCGPRRKNSPGKSNSIGNNSHRQHDRPGALASYATAGADRMPSNYLSNSGGVLKKH